MPRKAGTPAFFFGAALNTQTKKALLGSVRHWYSIAYAKGETRGPENCALCLAFNNHDTHDAGIDCEGCPVADVTRYRFCARTPWDTWADHRRDEHRKCDPSAHGGVRGCVTCKRIAITEFEFLFSLLPTADQKAAIKTKKFLKWKNPRVLPVAFMPS